MYRAKCPTCGRRQPAQLSEAGQTIFCAACGTRFTVQLEQIPDNETTLPDVDFFPTLHLPQAPPPPEPAAAPAIAAPSGILPAVPHPMPAQTSGPVDPPPPSDPTPITLDEARSTRWGPATIVLAILILCVTFSLGIVLGYAIGTTSAPSQPASADLIPKASTPAPKPVEEPQVATLLPSTLPTAPATAPSTAPTPTPAPAVAQAPAPPPAPIPVPVKFRPVRPKLNNDDLDDRIGKALDDGVTFLLSQFQDGKLKSYSPGGDGRSAGMDALAVYALLHAAEANHDLRLGVNTPLVGQLLDNLKKMPMNLTYARSLRAAALGVYHRAADKQAMREDCQWLIASAQNGAYGYFPPPAGARRGAGMSIIGGWDNSNSQYGALGVWAGLEAGVEVSNSYWNAVQKHWLTCQLPDGQWGYTGYGSMGQLSMTVAGITTLLVTEDQLDARVVVTSLGHPPFTPALQRGLNWLEFGDNSVRLPGMWRTYNLFGLERAALASGFKYFGDHDWYRELARQQLGTQDSDGSWTDLNSIIGTSYTLLFLSRGRHPIFMNKLRFDGFWSNRPRDIANLAHYATTVLERPINWQVVSFKSDWTDWMDSPVLYIASHEALKFTDEQCAKLRAFAQNGGLIFTHADGGSTAFNNSVADLSKRLFPQYPLTDLPATHPIFSTNYKIKDTPHLQGVSNGSRLLLLNSAEDLNKYWQLRDPLEKPINFQTGLNIFIYAAGKANLRNRLKTPVVPEPNVTPILTTTIAQVRHAGDWNPEPAGLPRFARLFLGQTSVKVNVVEADANTLDAGKMPLAHLTGTGLVHFTADELKSLHDYVNSGGTLLVDACGGSTDFQRSVLTELLPRAFAPSLPSAFPADSPILTGTDAGMSKLSLKLRPYRGETGGATTEPLQYLTLGKGQVILSTVDISTGLLGTNTWPINGYEPENCYDLVSNLLLSLLER
jgi:hypothetical protein